MIFDAAAVSARGVAPGRDQAAVRAAAGSGAAVHAKRGLSGGAAAPSWKAVPTLPLLVVQLALLGTGLGLLLSALTAKYRDLQSLISVAVQLWMFATPVVYPLSSLTRGTPLHTAMLINPVTMPMELFRSVLLGTGSVSAGWYACSWGITLLIAVLGLAAFRRRERNFIDTV